jgi:hypothetical protein
MNAFVWRFLVDFLVGRVEDMDTCTVNASEGVVRFG